METLMLVGATAGGLGLFLLAIDMMTDGLKLGAGSSLRKLLSEWSRTPLRGIFSGFFMTAIVQSSSAVTVASLGFVNAGLLSMRQALGIIYGANVGTTMTAWLVALIGFELNIQSFALPMIGIGMLVNLIKQRGKWASFGWALVGFGLFFIGIDILKGAFEGIVQTFDISKFTAAGASGLVTFLMIGIVMTILTQSSSASIALTITAAASGAVGVYAAGAMVVGANIGTTSTALIAAIGATSNAKRVATAQMIFNVATALVALLILPVLFYLIDVATQFFDLTVNPAISLALFHTVFNVLGVMLVYPFNDRLATFLDARFHSWEDEASHPKFLDKTIAQTPVLAVNALVLENLAISEKIIALYLKSLQSNPSEDPLFESELAVIKILSSEVSKFIVSIESSEVGEETTEDLAMLMRIDQYLLSSALSVKRLASQFEKRRQFEAVDLEANYIKYFNAILTFMMACQAREIETPDLLHDRFSALKIEHEEIKAGLIIEGTRAHISVGQMSESVDCLSEAYRMAQQWFKAFTRFQIIQDKLEQSTTKSESEISADDAII